MSKYPSYKKRNSLLRGFKNMTEAYRIVKLHSVPLLLEQLHS